MATIRFLGVGLAALVLAGVDSSWAVERLVLVDHGQARCRIVVGSAASPRARDAATELAETLEAMAGVKVAVAAEDAVETAPKSEALILIGDGERARKLGVESKDLPPEGFVVRAVGNNLVLVGSDLAPSGRYTNGTFFAVATLEEDILGCRWLWPGEDGTIIPKRKTVTVPGDLHIAQHPKLAMRNWRNGLDPGFFWTAAVKKRIGYDQEAHYRMAREYDVWARRQKMGASLWITSGHAYEGWYDLYAKDHPDWFAQQLNGSREWDTKWCGSQYAKLCVSNPEVIREVIRQSLASLKIDPKSHKPAAGRGGFTKVVGIGENDGGFQGYCLCEKCKAWDEPSQPVKYKLEWATGSMEYPALTDRAIRFYSRVAEGIAAVDPSVLVVGFAYGATTAPPVKAKAHPNLVIQYVGAGSPYDSESEWREQRKEWIQWEKTGVKLSWRPNWLRAGLDMLMLYHHRLANDLTYFTAHGLIGTDFDTQMHDWATQGLNYYVIAKYGWNTERDLEALLDDYCRAGFGPAAGSIRAFFDRVEAMTTARAKDWSEPQPWAETVIGYFADKKFLAECRRFLDQARRQAAGDKAIEARIDFLNTGLEFTRLRASLIAGTIAQSQGKPVDVRELATLARQNETFLKAHRSTFAVNVPYAVWDQIRFPQWYTPKEKK